MRGLLVGLLLGALVTGCNFNSGGSDCSGQQRCDEDDEIVWTCLDGKWRGTACSSHQVCVQPAPTRALCALSRARDPKCEEPDINYCDAENDRLVQCNAGFGVSVEDCAATGRSCTEKVVYQCVESASSDARCATPHHTFVCDGDFVIECTNAYVIRSQACPGGCIDRGALFASCVLPNSAELCAGADASSGSLCDGSIFYYCDQGMAFEIGDCALEGNVCVESSAQDPRGSGCLEPER
jgi:hypothetical protein